MIQTINVYLRPKMSLRRPHIGWNAVEVIRYALPTKELTDPALKYAEMVGSAVLTIVWSKKASNTTNCNAAKTTRIALVHKECHHTDGAELDDDAHNSPPA